MLNKYNKISVIGHQKKPRKSGYLSKLAKYANKLKLSKLCYQNFFANK